MPRGIASGTGEGLSLQWHGKGGGGLGWSDQQRPCPQMQEHMQGRQRCLSGKRFTQGVVPASFGFHQKVVRSLRPNPQEAKGALLAPHVPRAVQGASTDVPACLDWVQIVCFCQKALGWLLVPPTVLPPSIVSMLSSTYSEGMKSSLYLSLSSPPSLPAHLTTAVSPCGTNTANLLSPPPPQGGQMWDQLPDWRRRFQQGQGTTQDGLSAACWELSGQARTREEGGNTYTCEKEGMVDPVNEVGCH